MESSKRDRIRFAGDSDLTFVNYGTDLKDGLSYRREARLHNADRRRQTNAQVTQTNNTVVNQQQESTSMIKFNPQPVLVHDPLATFGRDPFCKDVRIPAQTLEQEWRSIFTGYFHLPRIQNTHLGIQDPSDYFLNTARSSQDLYRSLVLQAVITNEAATGQPVHGDVMKNQALIIRDVRRLVELYNTPTVRLTSLQFQNIYASVFSLIGDSFNKEAGYNAIVFANCLLMVVPHNQAISQTPISEWIRMLMPPPGPSFHQLEPFRREMFRKINLVLDFLDAVQQNLDVPFSGQLSQYLQPRTALYVMITTPLPSENFNEPFQGFYCVCLHRILSMIYRIFDCISHDQSQDDQHIPSKLENLASACLQVTMPHRTALFLWLLITNGKTIGLKDNREEPLFPWAMKDLLLLHGFSFINEMVAWLLHKGNPSMFSDQPTLDMAPLREKMPIFYEIG